MPADQNPVPCRTGCLLCGHELQYREEAVSMVCALCGTSAATTVHCIRDHYVCDHCHSDKANDWIEKTVVHSHSDNPVDLAIRLSRSPLVKMHGPEHHFLVPAVLLSAYYNHLGRPDEVKSSVEKARKRAENVLGGFCGFYGTCGAAVGTGIFISVITGSNPLSRSEWKPSNQMTAKALTVIADRGGPRCCKRDTFLAIEEAGKFLEDKFQISLPIPHPQC